MRLFHGHLGSVLAAATAWCATAIAAAQPLPDQRFTPNIQGVPPMLQRVEQGVADVGALSETLRAVDVQMDLRSPIGFTNVYRVPGRPDLLMRSSGAVYAIFPQSAYVHSDRGLTAVVPAGTVFSIGMPTTLNGPPQGIAPLLIPKTVHSAATLEALAPMDTSSALRRDQRVNTMLQVDERGNVYEPSALEQQNQNPSQNWDLEEVRYHQFVAAEPPEAATFLRTIVTDEQYRAQRLSELLQQAASQASGVKQ